MEIPAQLATPDLTETHANHAQGNSSAKAEPARAAVAPNAELVVPAEIVQQIRFELGDEVAVEVLSCPAQVRKACAGRWDVLPAAARKTKSSKPKKPFGMLMTIAGDFAANGIPAGIATKAKSSSNVPSHEETSKTLAYYRALREETDKQPKLPPKPKGFHVWPLEKQRAWTDAAKKEAHQGTEREAI